MFCRSCGAEIPGNARFCASCGAPVVPSNPPPLPHGSAAAPRRDRSGLWVGIIIAAVIVIAAAVAIPLLLLRDGEETTGTTGIPTTTPTTAEITTTSPASSITTTSIAATTTTTPAGPPGDSAGTWVAMGIPELPAGALVVSTVVSEQAVLIHALLEHRNALYAYLFDAGILVELPVAASECWGEDLDGLLAVWWEGEYDQDTYEPYDEHVYAYLLPDGPKTEVTGGDRHPFYPQVAGSWITWTESEPWEMNPEEYWAQRIYMVEVDPTGYPVDEPAELVSSAPAFVLGDSIWVYSFSGTHLAWENHEAHHAFEAGTYIMRIGGTGGELLPQKLGGQAWRPSIAADTVVYWDDALMAMDLDTMKVRTLDPEGDFATAAPTYAAYYRSVETADSWSYQILTRGYGSDQENLLAETDLDPYFSPAIATSATHVAAVVDEALLLFEWQGESR